MGSLNWTSNVLEKKLEKILWPGVVLRTLISPLLVYDEPQALYRTPHAKMKVLNISVHHRKGKPGQWARITLSAANFIALLGIDTSIPAETDPRAKIKVWIPIEYLPEPILMMLSEATSIHPSTSTSIHPSTSMSVHTHVGPLNPIKPESPDFTGSESDVEIIRLPSKRKHSKVSSPEVIVLSD
ncbi:hypothetical protein BDZ97DRAFT_1761937 [Flammula alnicola]|nr:hypothetical protein BDZ97DRAFT_1761937 [Flammula alnicola]